MRLTRWLAAPVTGLLVLGGIAIAAPAAFAATCTTSAAGGGCPFTDDPNIYNDGNNSEVVQQDVFSQPSGWSQTLTANSMENWTVAANEPNGNGAVISYPNAQTTMTIGSGEPDPISDLGSDFTSSWNNTDPSGSNQTYEWAYDVWLASTAEPSWTADQEIMIWTDTHGGRVPAGTDTGTYYTDPSGTKWEVWVRSGSNSVSTNAQTVSFVRGTSGITGDDAASGTIDFSGFISYLESNSYTESANLGVDQFDYGLEICSTGGNTLDYTLNSYSTVKNTGGSGEAPVVSTTAASSVGSTAATLNGSVNPEGATATYEFNYGTSTSYGTTVPSGGSSAGNGSSAVSESANLTGLSPNTTYDYQIEANNANGTSYGGNQTFTTNASGNAPVVSTSAASGVGSTTGTLNGTVNPEGAATTYQFDYGTTTGYGTSVPSGGASAGSGSSAVSESQALSGLSANTTYDYRIEATNATGTTYGSNQTFTTGSSGGGSADTVTATATNTHDDTVLKVFDVTGGVASGGAVVANGGYNSNSFHLTPNDSNSVLVEGSENISNSTALTPAANNTTTDNGTTAGVSSKYWYGDYTGTVTSGTQVTMGGTNTSGSWNTWAGYEVEPASGETPAYDSSGSPAAVDSGVTNQGTVTTASFTPASGSVLVAIVEGDGSAAQTLGVSDADGLTWTQQGSTYSVGDVGSIAVFTATVSGSGGGGSPVAPSVTTQAATGVNISTATLNGQVNPESQATTYQFDYGTTTSYGTSVPSGGSSAGSGSSAVSESYNLTGLSPDTTYDYRIEATNATGTTYGSNQTFETGSQSAPTSTSEAASGVESTEVTLNGTVNPEGAATTYQFNYGTTTGYGSVVPTGGGSAGSGTSTVNETANLTGLTPSTTYDYQIEATNSGGTTYGSNETFTTSATGGSPSADTVTATTNHSHYDTVLKVFDVSNGQTGGSHVVTGGYGNPEFSLTPNDSGSILLEGAEEIDGSTTISPVTNNSTTDHGTTAGNNAPWWYGDYTGTVTGSTAASMGASDGGNWSTWAGYEVEPQSGETASIYTTGTPVAVDSGDSNQSTVTTASFTPAAGSLEVAIVEANGSAAQTVSVSDANGLTWTEQGSTYSSAYDGTIAVFTASPGGSGGGGGTAPLTNSAAATSITSSGATLNGSVNPEGASTTYQFQYGTTTSYGSVSPSTAGSAGSGSSAVNESTTLTGLSAGTTYYYRLTATNATGTTYGAQESFTTSPTASAICYNSGAHCWEGASSAGDGVVFEPYNSGATTANGWVPTEIGTVNGTNCTSTCWPFVSGSGLNSRYQGDPVYQYQWANNQGLSAQSGYSVSGHDGQMVMGTTYTSGNAESYPADQLFVQSGSSSPYYQVDVYASNSEYSAGDSSYYPTWVGDDGGSLSNGAAVWTNNSTYLQWAYTTPQDS